jgi:hypothetical protein
MKKSNEVILSTVLLLAISACQQKPKDQWITADQNGKTRDTTVNNQHYRYYGGGWYPLILGRISPTTYNGYSASEISRPGFTPSRAVRSGGFGSSSRTGVS